MLINTTNIEKKIVDNDILNLFLLFLVFLDDDDDIFLSYVDSKKSTNKYKYEVNINAPTNAERFVPTHFPNNLLLNIP